MRSCLLLSATLAILGAGASVSQADEKTKAEKDTTAYELRIYYSPKGKLDDLHARFRNHTLKLFEKHGMKNIGYWVPIENPDNMLLYVVGHKSREAAKKSWADFLADPDWKKAYAESEKNGTLVSKIESYYMTVTDYSPMVKVGKSEGERVFEFRDYTSTPKNLEHLNARFRNHTVKLFEKHGMTNIAYWNLMSDQKTADNRLLYILSHKSVDAAKASFDAFRKDEAWVKARKESEEKAGGSLTAKDGVKSIFMKATDYSPLK